MSQKTPGTRTLNRMKKENLIDLYQDTIDNINKIERFVEDIEDYKQWIIKANGEVVNEEDGLLTIIKEYQKDAQKKLVEIKSTYNEILEGVEDEEWNKTQWIKTRMNEELKKFEDYSWSIRKFRDEVFWYTSTDWSTVKWLKEKSKNFYDSQVNKYNEFYEKIESELQGWTTSIALSKTFKDKVLEYKKNKNLWSILFIFLMLILLWYYWARTRGSEAPWYDVLFRSLLYYSPFFWFAVWLAIFMTNRRAENHKLEEIYKHKESMATSFVWYRKSVKTLDTNDNSLLLKHMDNILDAINLDASTFITWVGEKHPMAETMKKMTEKATDAVNDIVEDSIESTVQRTENTIE